MNWEGKRVFITGGAGFIGSHLAHRLSRLGAKLGLYIHRNETPLTGKRLYGDLGNSRQVNDLRAFLMDFNPEFVFHLAAQPLVQVAMSKELETLNINIDGTYNLLHSCIGLHDLKSFVYVSTDKVYGDYSVAVNESFKLKGTDHPYNSSKLCGDILAQMYAKAFGIPAVISRSGNIYGAGDGNLDRIIPGAITATMRGESLVIRSDGKMVRDYIHVDDIIDAYLLLADINSQGKNLHGEAVNFGAHQPLSVLDIVHEVLGEMGRIDLTPKIENTARLEIPYQHLDWSVAKALGWSPKVELADGIKKTIPWYRGRYGKN